MKKSLNLLIALLLALSIIFPTVYTLQKSIILLICLALATWVSLKYTIAISRPLLSLSLIYAIAGMAWSIYGLALGNPGALQVLTVMVAYPLLLPILAFCYKKEDNLKLEKLLINIGWILVIFDLSYLVGNMYAPSNAFIAYIENLFKDNAIIDQGDAYFKFTIPNISSLIFLLPFTLVALINKSGKKYYLFILSALMLVVVILSGRRALFVATIIGILLSFIITTSVKSKNGESNKSILSYVFKFIIFSLAVGIGLSFFDGLDFYIQQISSTLDFENNASNTERAIQFDALLSGIMKAPFFGNGAGAAANYSRSETQAWAYELSYVAFIFQYGLVGFILYMAGILILIYHLVLKTREKGRECFEFYFLTGFVCFMIANATNPYLAKFDYMWIIFIPYAIINNTMTQKRAKNPQRVLND